MRFLIEGEFVLIFKVHKIYESLSKRQLHFKTLAKITRATRSHRRPTEKWLFDGIDGMDEMVMVMETQPSRTCGPVTEYVLNWVTATATASWWQRKYMCLVYTRALWTVLCIDVRDRRRFGSVRVSVHCTRFLFLFLWFRVFGCLAVWLRQTYEDKTRQEPH